jgi:hypothetical protein
MAAMDAFLSMIGDLAAGVAAVAALAGARYARQTVREARAERLDAEHVRLVRRLEWVGETIEHIDRLAEDDQHSRPAGETWRRGRHLLAQGFVGFESQLPRTAELIRCADPYSARSIARLAREEVGSELHRLAREQARRHEDRAATDQTGPAWAARLTRARLPGRRREPSREIPAHHQHRLRRSHGD